jgi:tetratricopeptide (TPR) repeat protein
MHVGFFDRFSKKGKTPHQLLMQGKLREALDGFLKQLEAKPNHQESMLQIADLYRRLDQPERALPYLVRLGDMLHQKGFINKSVACYRKALNIDPNHAEVLDKLAAMSRENDSYLLTDFAPEDPDQEEEESFDITSEDLGNLEDSLRLELETISSEIQELKLDSLPSFDAPLTADPDADPSPSEANVPPTVMEEKPKPTAEPTPNPLPQNTPNTQTHTEASSGFESVDDALDAVFGQALANASAKKSAPTPSPSSKAILEDPNHWSLFQGLPSDSFLALIQALNTKTVDPGQYIIRQGDDGDELFLIIEGSVEVTITIDHAVHKVAVLHSGDYFGEGALLTKSKRNASIRALKSTELLTLTKASFVPLIRKHPIVFENMKTGFLARRARNLKLQQKG